MSISQLVTFESLQLYSKFLLIGFKPFLVDPCYNQHSASVLLLVDATLSKSSEVKVFLFPTSLHNGFKLKNAEYFYETTIN